MKSLNGKGKRMPWEVSKKNKKGWSKASRDGFYNDRKWQKIRDYVITNEPLCRSCLERGKVVPAKDVDHIIDVDDDPSLAYDIDNLCPLCKTCHQIKRNLKGTRKDPANLAKGQKLMDNLEAE